MSADKPHDPNTGVLFPNSEKYIAEKTGRPNHGGEATVICQHCTRVSRYRVAAWNNKSKAQGKPFMALQFSKPLEKHERAKAH